MDLSKQLELLKRDINDPDSAINRYVVPASGKTKDEFLSELSEGIRKANELSFYGGYDKVYAAYTFVDGNQMYFKFSAPKKEMQEAVGSGAPYLEMYNGGIYLLELSPEILMKYVLPFYYKEFGTFSAAYAEHLAVKAWHNFVVSED